MTGIPVALALGVPAGTFIGQHLQLARRVSRDHRRSHRRDHLDRGRRPRCLQRCSGWRCGASGDRASHASRSPGFCPSAVVLLYVLGHTIVYSYIAPYLEAVGLGSQVDLILLVFGPSLVSICANQAITSSEPLAHPGAGGLDPVRFSARYCLGDELDRDPDLDRDRHLGVLDGAEYPHSCRPRHRERPWCTAPLRPTPRKRSSSRSGTRRWHSVNSSAASS